MHTPASAIEELVKYRNSGYRNPVVHPPCSSIVYPTLDTPYNSKNWTSRRKVRYHGPGSRANWARITLRCSFRLIIMR